MAIEFTTINGKNVHLDTEAFEQSLRQRFEDTCEDAKVYLFNNFPVVVTENTFIDLILLLALKDIRGNYFRVEKVGGHCYIKNMIMPLRFVTGYKNDEIRTDNGDLIREEAEINYEYEIKALGKKLEDYLVNKCGIAERSLNIYPLYFIQNNATLVKDNYLVAPEFNFDSLERYLKECTINSFTSNYEWLDSSNQFDAYERVTSDITKVTEQASIDSKVGYLTKKKIERIGRKVARSTKKDSKVNESLVIISGKAGTGKSSELLTLMTKSLFKGDNALFLTYNKLLVFDLAKTIKTILDESDQDSKTFGETSILTLHAFFYRLSKSLGVLHVMSEERMKELKRILRSRLKALYYYLKKQEKYTLSEPEVMLEKFQHHKRFDVGTKELGIDLVRYAEITKQLLVTDIDLTFRNFNERKIKQLEQIATNEVFLSDYYGVLKNTLHQMENPSKYFDEFNIKSKGDLLRDIFNLNEDHIDEKNELREGVFIEKKNRKVGGFRRKRTLFVDEAQDCHFLEKDILIKIFEAKNIVIANGGIEQLIRHMELCNWEFSKGENLKPVKFRTTNKSYRVKKHILLLCQFIADKYDINLDLEPYEEGQEDSEDVGHIIIDFRKDPSQKEIDAILNNLHERAQVHGCSDYESILVLLESVGFKSISGNNDNKYDEEPPLGVVNEYDNIEDEYIYQRDEWKYLKDKNLKDYSYSFWDGTKHNKSKAGIPTPNDTRVIFYESCRGLEAWSTMCFNIDKFFDKKCEDPDAEKYLVGKEAEKLTTDLFLSNEDRKKMYAATWVLMATTRAMDTLYLQIDDKDSEFGKTIAEFLKNDPKNVKVIN